MNKILYIGNAISKHGYNKTTIETLGPSLEKEGYELLYTSDKKNLLLRFLDMVICTLTKVNKVDVVLIDTYSTASFWYAFFCSQIIRIYKIKYVPILHGGNLPNRLKRNPRLSKMIFKNAYKNVAPSNYLKCQFENAGYTNIVYIPNTIPLENYIFKKREYFRPNLLWVRAFASIYNPKMAVAVLLKLKEKFPNAKLTMVGPDKDGSMETTKQFAKKAGVEVCFTGKLTKEQWITLAKDQDIFINTTHFDNTPISVMEAMALGLLVVSTNVGGIPYLLNDKNDAYLVEDSNVNQMVEVIVQAIENTQQSQIVINSARDKVGNMDWEIVKKQWHSLLSNRVY